MQQKQNRVISGILAAVLICAALAGVVLAAGTAADPLITRAYLYNNYLSDLANQIHARVNAAQNGGALNEADVRALAEKAEAALTMEAIARIAADKLLEGMEWTQTVPQNNTMRQVTLRESKMLILAPGTVVRALPESRLWVFQPDNRGTVEEGTVVYIPAAAEKGGSWELTKSAYFIVSERSEMVLMSLYRDSEVMISGAYQLADAPVYTPQYADLCTALSIMGLFRGTGKGFELERAATRNETFTMLIRLLGEEAAATALAYRSHPFLDVEPWADPYVSYAYVKQYTNGVSPTEFAGSRVTTVQEYMTMLLRALGYSDLTAAPDFHYADAVQAAVRLGIFTQAEADRLTAGQFRRDHMVYISYYGLFAKMKGTDTTLLDTLLAKGAVEADKVAEALASVTRIR